MPVIIDEHTQYFNNGASVVNGFVYIGKVGTDPTILANRLDLFSDAGLITQVPNPQRTNARGQTLDGPIFTAEGSFSFELQNSGSVVIESILSMGATSGGLSLTTLFDVVGINALTAKGNPIVVAYVDKQQFSLTIISSPTGAMTLNIDGNGVVPIKNKGADILPGQFPANGLIVVAFNIIGPVFELVSGANLSVPSPIGDVTPNTVKATTFEGDAGGTTINEFSTDTSLNGSSDDAVPTEKAVRNFVEVINVASQAEMETASDITKKVTPGRQQFHPGSAKAWLRYNQGVPSILVSYNITSVTDHATGDFTVIFDVDFSTPNYAFAGMSDTEVNTNNGIICQNQNRSIPVAGSCALKSVQVASNGVGDSNNYIVFFGDQ